MLQVTKRAANGVVVIELSGRIDGGDSCRHIHHAFGTSLSEGRRKFVLDLGEVDWINSLGVGFLVAAAVSASREGAVIRVTGLDGRVGSVLHACGIVPHVWKDFADEKSAVASFD
jgi:anti-sigma B factor antagonist